MVVGARVHLAGRPRVPSPHSGGQHYCVECARYFVSAEVLADHRRTKLHKNRLKMVAAEPYTHADAEAYAGMAPPVK